MTGSHRFRMILRWLALVAAVSIVSTFAWGPRSREHVTRQIVVYGGTAILLVWSITDSVLFFRDTVEKKSLHNRTTGVDFSRADKPSSRKSQFLTPEDRNWSSAPAVATATLPLAGKTVLVADDDFEITQTLVMRFERLGMTALRTSDALQLLFGVHKVKTDLVVLDVNMPSGNGLALCELLNSDESLAGMPVIIYTSCSSEATMGRCRALGAHYVLKAPNSWQVIEKLVFELFHATRPAATKADQEPPAAALLIEPVAKTLSLDLPSIVPRAAPLPRLEPKPTFIEPPLAAPSPKLVPPVAAVVDNPNRIFRVLAIHLESDLLATLDQCSPLLHMSVVSEPNPELGYWGCLSESPDVVLLGAQSRVTAVTEVLARLKANPLCKRIPRLIVIGADGEAFGDPGDGTVADQFFRSPVSLDEITSALRLVFQQANPLSPEIKPADSPAPSVATAEENNTEERDGEETAAEEEGAPIKSDDTERKPRERPLVLVIDDDPDISAAIALRLRTYGVDVLPAFAGMPGFWKAVDIRPDVILCDMRMPDGEGNYIVGRLQSHPLTQNIPVIVITGQDNPGLKRVMMSMGVAAYFSKPIVMKDLTNELRRHIDLSDPVRTSSEIDATSRLPMSV